MTNALRNAIEIASPVFIMDIRKVSVFRSFLRELSYKQKERTGNYKKKNDSLLVTYIPCTKNTSVNKSRLPIILYFTSPIPLEYELLCPLKKKQLLMGSTRKINICFLHAKLSCLVSASTHHILWQIGKIIMLCGHGICVQINYYSVCNIYPLLCQFLCITR